MKTRLFAGAIVIALFFAGCKGDTGAPGPQGPAGSVSISEGSITAQSGDWTQATSDIYYINYTDDAITDPTTDIVECFVNRPFGPSPNSWFALPATNFDSDGDAVNFSFTNNTITFFYDFTSAPGDEFIFNVVVIPPSIAKKYPKTNWKDYNAVNALLQMQKSSVK